MYLPVADCLGLNLSINLYPGIKFVCFFKQVELNQSIITEKSIDFKYKYNFSTTLGT